MMGFVGVLRGVAIGGVIATECRPALLARSKMHPCAADLHTFVALSALSMRDRGDSRDMGARRVGHDENHTTSGALTHKRDR